MAPIFVPKSALDELDALEQRIYKEYDEKHKARGWKWLILLHY